MDRYNLEKSTIIQILGYDKPECARITHTRRPKTLTDIQVDEIIEYLSENLGNRVLNYTHIHNELGVECGISTFTNEAITVIPPARNPYLTMA